MSIKRIMLASLLLLTPAACSRSETPKEEQKQVATAQPPAQPPEQQPPANQQQPSQVEQQQAPAETTPAPIERPRARQQAQRREPRPVDETYKAPPANQETKNEQGNEPIVPPAPSRRGGTGTPADNSMNSGNAAATTPVTPPAPPRPTTALLPEGTVVDVRLSDRLSSVTNHVGDTFETILDRDLIVDGKMLAPKGSRVTGKVTDVAEAGKVKGLARMTLALTAIKVGEDRYPIDTSTISVQAENTKARDAKTIGAGAAIGAAIGAIAGGKKGAVIGGAVGGGAGTAGVLATRGKEVEFEPEHKFSFRLEKGVEMKIRE